MPASLSKVSVLASSMEYCPGRATKLIRCKRRALHEQSRVRKGSFHLSGKNQIDDADVPLNQPGPEVLGDVEGLRGRANLRTSMLSGRWPRKAMDSTTRTSAGQFAQTPPST